MRTMTIPLTNPNNLADFTILLQATLNSRMSPLGITVEEIYSLGQLAPNRNKMAELR